MKRPRFPWLAVILMLAAPSLVRAQAPQQESVETPNVTDGTCGGAAHNVPSGATGNAKMKVKIKLAGPNGELLPIVHADQIPLVACDGAAAVTVNEMNGIHAAAVGAGYTCDDGGANNCGNAPTGFTSWEFKAPGQVCGFLLAKSAGLEGRVYVGTDTQSGGTCAPTAVLASTNAGNTVGLDLLPQYLLQVNPNGVHGLVTFNVFPKGVSIPISFTVNTVLFGGSLTALHTAISTLFLGTGLGFLSTVGNVASSHFPGDFASGALVRISNVQVVDRIEVTAVPGQILTQETSVNKDDNGDSRRRR